MTHVITRAFVLTADALQMAQVVKAVSGVPLRVKKNERARFYALARRRTGRRGRIFE